MKRNMNVRKTLALLLTAALMLGMLVIPASATGFSDVSSTASYLDAVNYVSDNGIMTGTSSTKFSPSTTATRAMFVTVLYRKAGSPEPSQSASFSDVVSTAYYANAVAWAQHDSKIVSGTSSSLFSPNDSITREAAVTMLYRYAVYCDIDVSATTSITGYSDYSSVSTYARTAMAWAVATGVTTGTTSTTLSPKGTLTRAQIAVFITRFGTNVEKIVVGSDNFSFTNSPSNFTSTEYYINEEHWSRLLLKGLNYNDGDMLSYELFYMSAVEKLESDWSGSCYGMVAAVALDKMGKIAFNENYGYLADSMHDVTIAKGGIVESAINYYHLSQYVDNDMHGVVYGKDADALAQACIDNNGITALSYHYYNTAGEYVGHIVLVNSVSTITLKSGTTAYVFKIWDPNVNDKESSITISSNAKKVENGEETTQLSLLRIITDFSMFDALDIDGSDNNEETSASSASVAVLSGSDSSTSAAADSEELYEKSNQLTVRLATTFTITNGEGEYLSWDGEQLTGTMEVYSENVTVNGEEYASDLIVTVPQSDSFQFVPQNASANNWFSVIGSNCYAGASGKNIGEIIIDQSGSVILSGEDMEFDVAYFEEGKDGLLYMLSGSGSDSVTVRGGIDNLTASGLVGPCTIKTIDMDRVSTSVQFNAVLGDVLAIAQAGDTLTIVAEENTVQ